MNENLEQENSTLRDSCQSIQKSRLMKISRILNGYLVISVLIFLPAFGNDSEIVCGNEMVAPFELFSSICLPIGFIAFLWGTKLAVTLKEWRKFIFNLVKFAGPLPLVIQYYQVLQMMNLEIPSAWWLGFLK